MVIKGRKTYMYTPHSMNNPLIYSESKPLIDVFNLFMEKYHSVRLYIELDTTLNRLKERQEEQIDD